MSASMGEEETWGGEGLLLLDYPTSLSISLSLHDGLITSLASRKKIMKKIDMKKEGEERGRESKEREPVFFIFFARRGEKRSTR